MGGPGRAGGGGVEAAGEVSLVLDLENLLHPYRVEGSVAVGLERLVTLLRQIPGDVIYGVAVCDRRLCPEAALRLRDAGVRVFNHRGGEDAADRALVSRALNDLPPRTRTFVIGSGDGAFAEIASKAKALGIRVVVIAPRGGLSAALRLVADDVRFFVGRDASEVA